jgi:N-methylhydantoinase A
MKLIGVDVGGIFTVVVLFDADNNDTAIHKVPTTVDNPSRGVMQGVLELCRNVGTDPAGISHLYHGTTIATAEV